MVNLAEIITADAFVISDTHFGHSKILLFEPVRLEYLADYNSDVTDDCQRLLILMETVPSENWTQSIEIMDLCNRLIGFHDEMVVEKWNAVVTDDDVVLHLGDLAFRGIAEVTKKLNGEKILLRGNHDKKTSKALISDGWKDVIDNVKIIHGDHTFELTPSVDMFWNGLFVELCGERILFSHYPIYNDNEWDVKKYGRITTMLEDIYKSYECTVGIHGHTHSLSVKHHETEHANVSIEHCTGLRPLKISEVIANVNQRRIK